MHSLEMHNWKNFIEGDLNPDPACHAGVLPAELWPQILKSLFNNQSKISYVTSIISIVLYSDWL